MHHFWDNDLKKDIVVHKSVPLRFSTNATVTYLIYIHKCPKMANPILIS